MKITYIECLDILENLGLHIKTGRERKNLSIRELSDVLEIHHSTLMRIESGEGCHTATAIKILEWLEDNSN